MRFRGNASDEEALSHWTLAEELCGQNDHRQQSMAVRGALVARPQSSSVSVSASERGVKQEDQRDMPIQRLSHVVLWVSNASRTAAFYEEILDFRVVSSTRGGRSIFMQAPDSSNDHDLGLFEIGDGAGPSTAGRQTVGMYHIAWEVDSLLELGRIGQALADRGALVGATNHGTTKSLYAQGPRWTRVRGAVAPSGGLHHAEDRIVQGLPLDLEREIERFGATTRGGVGVSH